MSAVAIERKNNKNLTQGRRRRISTAPPVRDIRGSSSIVEQIIGGSSNKSHQASEGAKGASCLDAEIE